MTVTCVPIYIHTALGMKMKRFCIGLLCFSITLLAANAALPTGDMQGLVAAVRSVPVNNGVNAFEVHFSSVTSDRWGCLSAKWKVGDIRGGVRSYCGEFQTNVCAFTVGSTDGKRACVRFGR